MQTARLFINGRCQAVRLPIEFRFEGHDVYIRKIGDAVLLLPVGKEWETLLSGPDHFTPISWPAEEVRAPTRFGNPSNDVSHGHRHLRLRDKEKAPAPPERISVSKELTCKC